jgi:hypothetical protein
MTTTYGIFSYLLRCCHLHFHFLRVFSLNESCRTVFDIKSGSMLCYAMLLKRLSVLFDTPDITETDLITICNFFDNFSGKIQIQFEENKIKRSKRCKN